VITRIVETRPPLCRRGCNAQPWQLTVTKGAHRPLSATRTLAQEIAKGHPPPRSSLAHIGQWRLRHRRRACGFQLYDAVAIDKADCAGRAAQIWRELCAI